MILKDYFNKMIGFNADSTAASSENLTTPNNSNETTKTQDNKKESNEKQDEKNEQESINPKNQEKMNKTQDTTKKAHVYNLIIVDESGSMSGLEHAIITGVNETINSIRGAQKEFAETQEHFLTLVTFDLNGSTHPVRTLIDKEPIANVKDFDNYNPYGSTPLYDAMGQSISALHNHIKNDNDASAVVTVLTDGYENASREWTGANLKALIEKLTAEGWVFSYMGSNHDVKQVSFNLSITNTVEFSHDRRGTSNTWARERSAKRRYFGKINEMMENRCSIGDLKNYKRRMASEYYSPRVTPERIHTLQEGEIFVFGSDPQGLHSGGAARVAMDRFGAVCGQGEGLQGQSYALPTACPLNQMAEAVGRFTTFAEQHPELRFLVTEVGCGAAGHNIHDVAPLFHNCILLENVALPRRFWDVLGLKV